jgi:putative flavoprotein involved in K+ transport
MSYLLTQQDRDHVVLEKRERVGESWRGRWDSFTLVTPNWQLQLPGYAYPGDDPDGFMPRDEVVAYLQDYAAMFDPPIRFGVEVTSVEENGQGSGYLVHTDDRTFQADEVVAAVGSFQQPKIPGYSKNAPPDIVQLHSSEYRNPQSLPDGAVLVVGSGQSGCQIAQELNESGRKVYLCTGSAIRLPRRYRGKDVMWWASQVGMFDQTVDQLDSPDGRFAANPQASGKNGGQDINLHAFAREGIVLLGRLQDLRGHKAFLGPDLHENLARADKAASEFRKGVDMYVQKAGLDLPEETVSEPQDGYEQEVIRELDLRQAGIETIVWATGFDYDYSWIQLSIFDDDGYPIQERGITRYPGLYFLGLHWLYKRKSGLFFGIAEDATYIAEHIADRAVR